jgi:hypothetical protein
MFCEIEDYVLIVEVDENQHEDYETSCENKRLCELYKDFGFRNMLCIRFNPDNYVNENGDKITSCFGYDKHGICKLKKSKVKEFNERIKVLCNCITERKPSKSITIVNLFYDHS